MKQRSVAVAFTYLMVLWPSSFRAGFCSKELALYLLQVADYISAFCKFACLTARLVGTF